MKFMTILAAALSLVFTTAAEARHRHPASHHHLVQVNSQQVIICNDRFGCNASRKAAHTSVRHIRYIRAVNDDERIVGHPPGCPRTAFCGCGVSWKVFGHLVRDLYLAANWYKFPRTHAAHGMVAIFGRHHVAYIEAVDANGNATLYDPNSGGHKTRIHTRNISGATVVNPNG